MGGDARRTGRSIEHAGVGSSGYSLDIRVENDTVLRLLVREDDVDLQGDFSLHRWTPSQALQTIALHRNLLEFRSYELEIGEHVISLQRSGAHANDSAARQALSDI